MSEREALLRNLLHELKDAPLAYLRMWHEAIRSFHAHAPDLPEADSPSPVDEAAVWDEVIADTYEARKRAAQAFEDKMDRLF